MEERTAEAVWGRVREQEKFWWKDGVEAEASLYSLELKAAFDIILNRDKQ